MLREPVVEHRAVGALPVQEDRGRRDHGVDENPRQQYGREPRVPRVVDEMHEPQDERQDETDDQIAQQPQNSMNGTVVRPPMFSGSFA